MVAILDYDAGNIKSVEKAFKFLGADVVTTRDEAEIARADHVVLPGVGAFGDAMSKLNEYKLVDVIKKTVKSDVPFIGICLGLQLMFDSSEESEGVDGLGIFRGKIRRIPQANGLKIPQIGWNDLTYAKKGRLFEGVPEHSFVYFVHSYYLDAMDKDIVTATTDYGVKVEASVEKGNVFACQFHPEKSSEVGMQILKNFLEV
ncbi:MAG: imidazole glycerol phosphate synthase subunit HisH [Butyrivibrio sp.]|uniref:imidazole glycerol phosphate synthase subunit HisH n=1 Tax=Butyrivibrio sp. TaxID=28121 RepID=UPI0025D84BE9|nr:imidazole glycerol phosphate synthase subunit HisH [Butyrivibrio sp.]MCR5770980.1 imidazole glycerol phosphate synthase subunit HisH [Butyrivibrio sp.]